ncbi:MAG: hypothetical protein GEU78_11470 [Actinobacteria bacterium]|nr:hypothetical protein [Actinomycetota bacterium]
MADIRWPKFDLDKSVEVARVIAQDGGGRVSQGQLAALLNYAGTGSGTFVNRVSAARQFGLIQGRSSVSPTPLAHEILDPVYPEQRTGALFNAFLSVPLYRAIFERFQNKTLPTSKGFENALRAEFSVPEQHLARVRSRFMKSAEQAGLFDVAGDHSRLLAPIQGATPGVSDVPIEAEATQALTETSVPTTIPKVILGMLEAIPWGSGLDDEQIDQVAEVIKSNMRLHFMFQSQGKEVR